MLSDQRLRQKRIGISVQIATKQCVDTVYNLEGGILNIETGLRYVTSAQ